MYSNECCKTPKTNVNNYKPNGTGSDHYSPDTIDQAF